MGLYSSSITAEELRSLPEPIAMGPRHKPIAHHEVVSTLQSTLANLGWEVTRTDVAVSGTRNVDIDGERHALENVNLFGVCSIRPNGGIHGKLGEKQVGFRSSTAQVRAVEFFAGYYVFVCSNGLYSYETHVLKHKSTTRFQLEAAMAETLSQSIPQAFRKMGERTAEMIATPMTENQAYAQLGRMVHARALPSRFLAPAAEAFLNPQDGWEDCKGGHQFALMNATTRATRELPPHQLQPVTQACAAHFGF